jgi:hypothetical protein
MQNAVVQLSPLDKLMSFASDDTAVITEIDQRGSEVVIWKREDSGLDELQVGAQL